jgi:rhodanese-related sulfurtransferase
LPRGPGVDIKPVTIEGMKHLLPKEAWDFLQQQPQALLIDVRMEIESLYVGRPPGAHNIAWYEYPDMVPDPASFIAAVQREAGGNKNRPVLLLCRNGKRTIDAGMALEKAGFGDVINVLHGFEGDLDDDFKRSTLNGWRFDGLPWEQM